ncbi:MT-A70 family methyltransferase [Aeromonas veronii]
MNIDIFNTDRKYRVIYADPAWQFNNKNTGGSMTSSAEAQYTVTSLADMAALPVSKLADDHCLLVMWWVGSMPQEAIDLCKAWGFRLVNMNGFVWRKMTKRWLSHFGMGFTTRAGSESALIGVRGKLSELIKDRAVRAVIEAEVGKHSQKPNEFRVAIQKMCGDVPRIELFARESAAGWDCWGNEAPEAEATSAPVNPLADIEPLADWRNFPAVKAVMYQVDEVELLTPSNTNLLAGYVRDIIDSGSDDATTLTCATDMASRLLHPEPCAERMVPDKEAKPVVAVALNISDMGAKIAEVEKAYRGYREEFGIEDHQVIVNNSGGKDSGATELLARAIVGDNYRSVAADTGNEHPITIEHLKTLHLQRGGSPVEIVSADYTQEMFDKRREAITKAWQRKQIVMAGAYRGIVMPSLARADTAFAELWRNRANSLGWGDFETPLDAALSALHRSGNPFLDMALIHGGFPLGRQRFCTDELKIQVVFDKVLSPLLDAGKDVVQWSGVRADESEKRATYDRFSEDKRDSSGHLFNFLPIHKWTAADVFALYRHFGVKPNPLYSKGMERVGCMPCILVAKNELAEVAARWPEEIERVAKWEQQVAMVSRWIHWMMVGHVDRRQFKSLGDNAKLGVNARLPHRSFVVDVEAYKGTCMLGPRGNVIGGSIYDAVEWAKTGKGGKTYDLVTAAIDTEVCSSKYGLCG